MLPHEIWKKREAELLDEAKKIYRKYSKANTSVDVENMGDDVYDLMDEDCWKKFRVAEVKIKQKYAIYEN